LTDGTETFGVRFGSIINSFAWASTPDATEPLPSRKVIIPVKNIYGWSNAREYEFRFLSTGTKQDRENYLAAMLCALGHVIHLNQDLAQPDHVRNDEHFLGSWIESYGKKVYLKKLEKNNPGQFFPTGLGHGWPYWRDHGFTNLRAFWDRDRYHSDPSSLDNDAVREPGNNKLGLAEFCNGNFLGEDSTYSEFNEGNEGKPHKLHYFPHPSLKDTDHPKFKAARISQIAIETLDTVTLETGKQGQRAYLKKVAAGVTVDHHSALAYLAIRHPPKSDLPDQMEELTINDTNVLLDYHKILIPKAIEYSAGILDYFFRGQLDVAAVQSGTQYQLQIINRSGQDLSGGTFQLFQDDASANANRTSIPLTISWDDNSTLADGAELDGTFSGAFGLDARFTLVYKGTIGVNASQEPLDPVDSGIAIAAQSFRVAPLAWWAMEGADPLSQPDSLRGLLLVPTFYSTATLSDVPGLIGSALRLHSEPGQDWGDIFYAGDEIACDSAGVTLVGWVRVSDLAPDPQNTVSLFYNFELSGSSHWFGITHRPGDDWRVYFDGFSYLTKPFLAGWQFLALTCNPKAGTLGFDVGQSGMVFASVPFGTFHPPSGGFPHLELQAYTYLGTGEMDADLDELALFKGVLAPAQLDYLYNAGSGRTWPSSSP
jgi:hypothetical protein